MVAALAQLHHHRLEPARLLAWIPRETLPPLWFTLWKTVRDAKYGKERLIIIIMDYTFQHRC